MIFPTYKAIDELGRIVLPKEIRKELNIQIRDKLKIEVENNKIILAKAQECCVFCGKTSNLKSHMGKSICGSCIKKINNP